MTIRCKMYPALNPHKRGTSGIDRVVEAYHKYLPQFDVELVSIEDHLFDLVAGHVGAGFTTGVPFVCHAHGMHWTADYPCDKWQYGVNAKLIDAIRHANEVTVPSAWVAESFQRDMRFTPHVVPHGIDVTEWEFAGERSDYVLWNKNRPGDVCDPRPVLELARRFSKEHFVTTYLPQGASKNNVNAIGTIPHDQMKVLVQTARVYLSTTKETFGIGVLEAMASGVPVLGYAHGGNVALIEHGVTGYLAEPGNTDDLAEGLNYCLHHWEVLGANGREKAKDYKWIDVCEQVARIYEMALEPEPPTVAVVIPVFNKSEEQIRRAIESASAQTYGQLVDIVVVDDGSSDPATVQQMVDEFKNGDARVRLVRKNNGGVATARNAGILSTNEKYICCLDSDDAIEPGFIETCVKALEADRSLGIAYTGLLGVFPDGKTQVSPWPPDFDYNRQLRKQNQIPTCCVFRREMWERLGGYNQKYAPDGAGAEDAELWLRAGAYGWNAKKVTDEPLFVYSFGGTVGGNPNYVEPDWIELHPWTKDGKHPFASVATPKKLSHPVRQYDEPDISVIIPVGPGHEEKVKNALDSLEAQTFRKWEAIVVWDNPDKPIPDVLVIAYPYVKWMHNAKSRGPGGARNNGVLHARAPFLVFLDADDWLYPDCLQEMLNAWIDNQAIIYTDFVGKAIIDDPGQLDESLQRNILWRNERTNETILSYHNRKDADFDCERAQAQPENPPYVWCNVTSLIPKVWHNEIGGFDEELASWEDVDYHWRMAKAGHCYHRIENELMVYQFHTGLRREHGRQEHKNLLQYLGAKHERIESMPCSGCGGKSRARQTPQSTGPFSSSAQGQVARMNDDDWVMCVFNSAHIGKRQITGGFIFDHRIDSPHGMINRGGNRWSNSYGQKGGGDKFLVHRADIQAQPHFFVPVEESVKATAPEPIKEPLPEPERIVEKSQVIVSDYGDGLQELAVVVPSVEEGITDDGPKTKFTFNLQMLPGVGPALAKQLEVAGITTEDAFVALGVEGLSKYRTISESKAQVILRTIEGMRQER